MKNSLSVVINTKNEAHNIAQCILSAQKVAQEIVVCDMQSTDGTREIARQMGAKVVSFKDVGYLEPARNAAITAAHGNWILLLDADERLGKTLVKVILKILADPQVDIIRFPRKNYMFGKWMQHGLRWPDYQTRLFRKGTVTWPNTIHAQAQIKGSVLDLEAEEYNAILHEHTTHLRSLILKTLQQAEQERFYDREKDLTPEMIEKRLTGEFPWRYYEHEGFRDGSEGYFSAKFMEFYRLLEFVFFWERKKKTADPLFQVVLQKIRPTHGSSLYRRVAPVYLRLKRKLHL